MDYKLFEFINGLAGKSYLMDSMMISLSKYGIYLALGIIISLLLFSSKRGLGIVGVISILVGLLTNILISALYFRDRPFVSHDVQLLLVKEPSGSFPSDSVMIMFVVAILIWQIKRLFGFIFLLLAFLTAFSRVYVGHHYPVDVIGGMAVGAMAVYFSSLIFCKMKMKRTVEKSNQINV